MYADDTQIFASSHDANELIVKLNSDFAQVRKWLITLPKPKREFLKRSFKFSGAMLWNQPPNGAKLVESISSFKTLIRL